jgi:hypothetical protein
VKYTNSTQRITHGGVSLLYKPRPNTHLALQPSPDGAREASPSQARGFLIVLELSARFPRYGFLTEKKHAHKARKVGGPVRARLSIRECHGCTRRSLLPASHGWAIWGYSFQKRILEGSRYEHDTCCLAYSSTA